MAGSGRFKGLVEEESNDPGKRRKSAKAQAPSGDAAGKIRVTSRPPIAPAAPRPAKDDPGYTVVDDDTPTGKVADEAAPAAAPAAAEPEPTARGGPGDSSDDHLMPGDTIAFESFAESLEFEPDEGDRVRAHSRLTELIRVARARRASDIHLVASLAPALRIGGEIVMLNTPPHDRSAMVRLVLGLLTPSQRRAFDETKELCYSAHDGELGRVRITAYLHAGIPELSIRLCTPDIPKASELGLPPVVDELARKPNGLVLVTGATGAGKTTTLNYLVDLINRDRRCKIIMIEDPVEFLHRPQRSIVVQQEVHSDTLSYTRALTHVLRQNPDVIAIGEMREIETIATALTAAETGHLVLATLHTPNAVQTIERIAGVFPASQQPQVLLQLSSSLQGVITQQLVPRADKQGRVLAYEVMLANHAVRNTIRENKPHLLYNMIETGRREGMVTMDNCLLDLYQKGLITYDAALSRATLPDRFGKRRGADSDDAPRGKPRAE